MRTRWKQVEALTFRDIIAEDIKGSGSFGTLVELGQTITPALRDKLTLSGVQWVSVIDHDGSGDERIKPLISPNSLETFRDEVKDIYDHIIDEGRIDKERAESLGKTIAQEVVDNFGELVIPSLYQLKDIDQYTFVHQVNVSIIATTIATTLFGDDHEKIQQVSVAGLLHDVGKTLIPEKILKNRERLSELEFNLIKKHPDYGYEIASQSGISDKDILDPILYHHERWDGKGYNAKIAGDSIPLTSRIMSLADVYDALTTERPYKKAWPAYQVASMIVKESSRMFDPSLVNTFLKVFGIYPTGTKVMLSTGQEATVIGTRQGFMTRPLVSIHTDTGVENLDLSEDTQVKILKVIHTKVEDA